MRPYKITIGCTRFLRSTTASEVINFQLYSQLDLTNLKLRVQELFEVYESYLDKPLEGQNNKSDLDIPTDPPEVYSTSISLPYINLSIRIDNREVKKLKQLVNEVFPSKYYIEVQ